MDLVMAVVVEVCCSSDYVAGGDLVGSGPGWSLKSSYPTNHIDSTQGNQDSKSLLDERLTLTSVF